MYVGVIASGWKGVGVMVASAAARISTGWPITPKGYSPIKTITSNVRDGAIDRNVIIGVISMQVIARSNYISISYAVRSLIR